MRLRTLLILLIPLLLAVACGGETAVAPEPAAAPQTDAPADTETAVGKPQLIEFYAEW